MTSKEQTHDEIAQSLRTMNIDEDLAWVLDSLIGFLKSPIWTTSLNNFVDQHSVVFEPEEIETSDGKIRVIPEYEAIFNEYRGLVDRLITTHMTELGINEKAFAMACEMADGILAGRLKAVLFEELWAAENYEVFTRWMAKRNVELQLEALNTLAARHGMVYDVFVPFGSEVPDFLAGKKLGIASDGKNNEASPENEVATKKDNEDLQKHRRKISQHIEVEAEVVDSVLEPEMETEVLKNDKNRLEEVRDRVDSRIQESLLTILQSSPEPEVVAEPPPKPEVATKVSQKPQSDLSHLLTEESSTSAERAKSAEIEKRAEYLRTQRDKIIALRAKERTEHISKYIKGKGGKAGTSGEVKSNVAPTQVSDADATNPELAYRKSLAARLKAEIGGFSDEK